MSTVDFEVLKLIPKMMEEMQCLKQEVKAPNFDKPDFFKCNVID